jgi:hypothetical protein
MGTITTQRGRPQTVVRIEGRNRRERRINVGTIHLFGPGTEAACHIPAPRRVRYSGVLVAPRSIFAVFFGWSSGVAK